MCTPGTHYGQVKSAAILPQFLTCLLACLHSLWTTAKSLACTGVWSLPNSLTLSSFCLNLLKDGPSLAVLSIIPRYPVCLWSQESWQKREVENFACDCASDCYFSCAFFIYPVTAKASLPVGSSFGNNFPFSSVEILHFLHQCPQSHVLVEC